MLPWEAVTSEEPSREMKERWCRQGWHVQDAQGIQKGLIRQHARNGEQVRKKKDLKISPFRERFQREHLDVSSQQKHR